MRIYKSDDVILLDRKKRMDHFAVYFCKNCEEMTKTYAFSSWFLSNDLVNVCCFKYGEYPRFGPPNSSRLNSLVEGERDLFLKGRRCEMQGLGIAAFSYYRRVVESQKQRLFDQLIAACKRIPGAEATVEELEQAKTVTEFSRAVEKIKHGLPTSLLIGGCHNPLSLLHSPLSVGIHGLSDQECLERATDIRVILTELVERLANVLQDDKEVNLAVSRLLKGPSRNKPGRSEVP